MPSGWHTFTTPPPAWDQLAQQDFDTVWGWGGWVVLALLIIGGSYMLVCWLYQHAPWSLFVLGLLAVLGFWVGWQLGVGR